MPKSAVVLFFLILCITVSAPAVLAKDIVPHAVQRKKNSVKLDAAKNKSKIVAGKGRVKKVIAGNKKNAKVVTSRHKRKVVHKRVLKAPLVAIIPAKKTLATWLD